MRLSVGPARLLDDALPEGTWQVLSFQPSALGMDATPGCSESHPTWRCQEWTFPPALVPPHHLCVPPPFPALPGIQGTAFLFAVPHSQHAVGILSKVFANRLVLALLWCVRGAEPCCGCVRAQLIPFLLEMDQNTLL